VRLSEAIRLGAMIRPQAVFLYFRDGNSCALGAALEATGIAYDDVEFANDDLRMRWLWVFTTQAACPVCQVGARVRQVIPHLNNEHRWTREQIADWVESVEPLASPDSAPAVREAAEASIVPLREERISSSVLSLKI
jgi:hypothetical protein